MFRLAELVKEKLLRGERLKEYAFKITKLWDRLEITAAERQAFFGKNRGLGEATLNCVWEHAKFTEIVFPILFLLFGLLYSISV